MIRGSQAKAFVKSKLGNLLNIFWTNDFLSTYLAFFFFLMKDTYNIDIHAKYNEDPLIHLEYDSECG